MPPAQAAPPRTTHYTPRTMHALLHELAPSPPPDLFDQHVERVARWRVQKTMHPAYRTLRRRPSGTLNCSSALDTPFRDAAQRFVTVL